MPKIVFNNVEVVYIGKKSQEFPALKGFSAEFLDSKMNVIIGFSGCGKTTLLRVITGQVNYGGEVKLNDVDLNDISIKDRNVSVVQQNYAIYPHLNVFENLAFPLKLMKYSYEEITKRVLEMAELLGLRHCLTKKPKYLSGGQQQKVALGKALIKRPDILLFDEPLSNIDKEARDDLIFYIKKLATSYGTTCIYITHNIEEATRLADKIFVMNDGKLEISGTPIEIATCENKIVKDLFEGKVEE